MRSAVIGIVLAMATCSAAALAYLVKQRRKSVALQPIQVGAAGSAYAVFRDEEGSVMGLTGPQHESRFPAESKRGGGDIALTPIVPMVV